MTYDDLRGTAGCRVRFGSPDGIGERAAQSWSGARSEKVLHDSIGAAQCGEAVRLTSDY